MNAYYEDILKRIQERPQWYDEHAVPRYEPFSPRMLANIYAAEAVLLEIQCQGCGERILVSMSWCRLQETLKRVTGYKAEILSLADLVQQHNIFYSDPPAHNCVGDTMTSESIRVKEFWKKNGVRDWERVPDLEIDFPQDEAQAATIESLRRRVEELEAQAGREVEADRSYLDAPQRTGGAE